MALAVLIFSEGFGFRFYGMNVAWYPPLLANHSLEQKAEGLWFLVNIKTHHMFQGILTNLSPTNRHFHMDFLLHTPLQFLAFPEYNCLLPELLWCHLTDFFENMSLLFDVLLYHKVINPKHYKKSDESCSFENFCNFAKRKSYFWFKVPFLGSK